jgi:protection of telomeres protein 1
MWNGYISLLTNQSSAIHVFHATTIPSWPSTNLCLLSKTAPGGKSPVSTAEMEYAAWLFHYIDKALFPEAEEFRERSQNAMKKKEKFSLLKDIKVHNFYDLIGEVIRVYEIDGRVTMYISDYTAHSLFYNNVWGDGEEDNSSMRDGDQYGYTKSRKKVQSDWPGPYGKLSLQLTIYDSHAAFIREKVKNGDWLLLKNIQIKMGSQGGCLEGFLRGDRDGWEDKVQIQIIRKAEDAEMNDVRWKEGLRRKKEWWDRFKKQKQKFLEEAKEPMGKRRLEAAELSKPNSKKRRKEKRALVEQKQVAIEQRIQERLDLNSNGMHLYFCNVINDLC